MLMANGWPSMSLPDINDREGHARIVEMFKKALGVLNSFRLAVLRRGRGKASRSITGIAASMDALGTTKDKMKKDVDDWLSRS